MEGWGILTGRSSDCLLWHTGLETGPGRVPMQSGNSQGKKVTAGVEGRDGGGAGAGSREKREGFADKISVGRRVALKREGL